MQTTKAIFCICMCIGSMNLHADFPYDTDFSFSTQVLNDPPALPQVYGVTLPNAWQYYATQTNQPQRNPFLPDTLMPMEVCVISSIQYHYPTQADLMQGCHQGDSGLQYFILQPYQYMPAISKLNEVKLIPRNLPMQKNPNIELPKILIFYRNIAYKQMPAASIALGNFENQKSNIVINGYAFQYNLDVMRTFYSLVHEIQEQAYLPENIK